LSTALCYCDVLAGRSKAACRRGEKGGGASPCVSTWCQHLAPESGTLPPHPGVSPLEETVMQQHTRRIVMQQITGFVTALALVLLPGAPASAASFFFSTGNPDGRLGALTRPANS